MAEEEYDPEDTDCSRCHTPVWWNDGDGIGVKPPEDPDERICNACVWKELDQLRAEKKAHQDAFGHLALEVRIDSRQPRAAMYYVRITGFSSELRSKFLSLEEASALLTVLRSALDVT